MRSEWSELVRMCRDHGYQPPVIRKKMWCYVAEIPHAHCACHYNLDEAISLSIDWIKANGRLP